LEIRLASHGLFRSIVEVVAEGRPDLGLRLNGGNQPMITDDEQIPLFGRPKETGQLDRPFPEDEPLGNPGLGDRFGEQVDEAVHLCPASHGATQSLVGFPACFLFLPLVSTGLPVVGNRLRGALIQVLHRIVLIHTGSLTDSFLISHRRTLQFTE
jgi:hypothetical protein